VASEAHVAAFSAAVNCVCTFAMSRYLYTESCDTESNALQVVERLKAIRESGAIAKMDVQEQEDVRQMKKGLCCFGS
jgi:hypothetical protein